MDPITILAVVGIIVTLVLTIFQSIKSGHFKSKCGKNSMEVDVKTRETKK